MILQFQGEYDLLFPTHANLFPFRRVILFYYFLYTSILGAKYPTLQIS